MQSTRHVLPHRLILTLQPGVPPLCSDLSVGPISLFQLSGFGHLQVINALNSGANVYMADFEDSNCPTWANLIEVCHCICDDRVPQRLRLASSACC